MPLPPRPHPFHGRASELRTLTAACRSGDHPRLALVGAGGSGKSTLAAALVHRLRRDYPGGAEWLRVGGWDHRTLLDMLAIRLGLPLGRLWAREERVAEVRRRIRARGPMLVVLDNHEDDAQMARFLNALADLPVLWLLTARRCLLAGVSVFPVASPLVTLGRNPFPRVHGLTSLLRWNVLALDVCDALVGGGAATVPALRRWLLAHGIGRVAPIAHEDDLPEVRLLLRWVWPRLSPASRRMLTVLGHLQGDHLDKRSLAALARVRRPSAGLARLRAWRLVQEPFPGRFTVHATVRHAVVARTRFDQRRAAHHFVTLLERHPERLDLEQTNLFAALDQAHTGGDFQQGLRLTKLLERLGLS
ncbi:MAG TPA: ATP-binding protein [Polyangia bacterium]|nr:ATP-binding protein [Polyangia bacterium]